MDILILGGGYGTRLFGKYNKDTYFPKGLVKINGKPCIEYALETFSDNLIGNIILETNKEGKLFYEEWLNKSNFKEKIEIYTEEISTPENCLGVLETINLVFNKYRFIKPVLIISPDNIFTMKQDELITNYTSGVKIATYYLKLLEDGKKYGVLELKSNNVISCIEKPSSPKSKIIRTSCEIWGPEAFSLLSTWNKTNNSDKVGDFINFLVKKEISVESHKTKGLWIDIGNKFDLEIAKVTLG